MDNDALIYNRYKVIQINQDYCLSHEVQMLLGRRSDGVEKLFCNTNYNNLVNSLLHK